MARIAGRNGRLYMGITSAGTAEPVAYLNTLDVTLASERFDVTAFGDTNKAYVAGLPDASGNFTGFYDNATAQMYNAAVDGVARKFYAYPDLTLPTQYFFGTAFFDFAIKLDVAGSADISGSWSAATSVAKVG